MNGLSFVCILSLGCTRIGKRARSRFAQGRGDRPFPSGSDSSRRYFAFELEPVMTTRRYTVSKLRFPSPIETPDAENNMVHAEYFAPVGFGPKRPGGHRLAHSGSGFSVVALHGGAAGRSRSRGPFCEASLLRRAPAAGGEGRRRSDFFPPTSSGASAAMRQGGL